MSNRKEDLNHLNLLKILHFVYGGLGIFGTVIFCAFQSIFLSFFISNSEKFDEELRRHAEQMSRENSESFHPDFNEFSEAFSVKEGTEFFGSLMLIMVVVFCVIGLVGSILNILSGKYLGEHRNRIFSIVMACLNLLSMPLGTALGIFTLITLTRQSVCDLYEENTGGKQRPDYLD